MNSREKVILRGTERYHMEAYLLMLGYHQEGPDVFVGEGIRVVFEAPRKVALGSLQLTEVEVYFVGDPQKVLAGAADLRNRFLTAGG